MSDEGEKRRNNESLAEPATPAGVGTVRLHSTEVMEGVRNVAGRTEAHAQESPYRSSTFIPGQVETIDFPMFGAITATTRDDRELAFPAHSVIVDNPTKLWLYVPAAQRFACPGLMNAVWQIPKASTKAEVIVRAPQGVVQAAVGTATQATLTFCEAWLMPTPGIISNAGGV
jgi:hypothetical protein